MSHIYQKHARYFDQSRAARLWKGGIFVNERERLLANTALRLQFSYDSNLHHSWWENSDGIDWNENILLSIGDTFYTRYRYVESQDTSPFGRINLSGYGAYHKDKEIWKNL